MSPSGSPIVIVVVALSLAAALATSNSSDAGGPGAPCVGPPCEPPWSGGTGGGPGVRPPPIGGPSTTAPVPPLSPSIDLPAPTPPAPVIIPPPPREKSQEREDCKCDPTSDGPSKAGKDGATDETDRGCCPD
jgi:hypothetical protein